MFSAALSCNALWPPFGGALCSLGTQGALVRRGCFILRANNVDFRPKAAQDQSQQPAQITTH
eukprot:2915194-Amphidinium_carterae.1